MVLLASVSFLMTACGNKNPASSVYLTPTPTPLNSQTIWANGNTGAFFGQNVSLVPYSCLVSNVNVPDPISGDNTTLQVSVTVNSQPATVDFFEPSPEGPGTYYASGHLQLDIKLGQSLSGNLQIGFAYSSSAAGGNYTNTFYNLPIASLNTASFTHVSIALSNFYNAAYVDEPFYILGPVGGSAGQPVAGTPVFTVDNIKWTSN
jgi:hypothetical protein